MRTILLILCVIVAYATESSADFNEKDFLSKLKQLSIKTKISRNENKTRTYKTKSSLIAIDNYPNVSKALVVLEPSAVSNNNTESFLALILFSKTLIKDNEIGNKLITNVNAVINEKKVKIIFTTGYSITINPMEESSGNVMLLNFEKI